MSWGRTPTGELALDRLSIELTNTCSKACAFCYNHSQPTGSEQWTPDEVVHFVTDCVDHGVRAVSFGGGEPLQYDGLAEVLARLQGVCFRSFTTNGLLLDVDAVAAMAPDKVHVSIHEVRRQPEVDRVIRQVQALAEAGVPSGVNLLVRRSELDEARVVARALGEAGIGPERIVYLPMRGGDTPTPRELGQVAGSPRFQSMTCLMGCAASPRFASIGWDKTVAWCSYTVTRLPLPTLDHAGLLATLRPLPLATC